MNLLFVHNSPTTFVEIDRDLLSRYCLLEVHYRIRDVTALVRTPFLVAWADVVVCWFASWHGVMPALAAATTP